MTTFIPQPYPLWCAEVYGLDSGEDTTISRVVAWKEGMDGELYPILARDHGAVTVADTDPQDTPALVFADAPNIARAKAEQLKAEWQRNRDKNIHAPNGQKAATRTGPTRCSWCDDYNNPSPEHHPDGQISHHPDPSRVRR